MNKKKARLRRSGSAEKAVDCEKAVRRRVPGSEASSAHDPGTRAEQPQGQQPEKPEARRSAAKSRTASGAEVDDGAHLSEPADVPSGGAADSSPDVDGGAVPGSPPVAAAAASLAPEHQALITASAITPEVAAARGYRTVRTKVELQALGFAKNQARVPTLLIPVHDVHGDVALYQARPQTPRIRRGKPLKYETPMGARITIDVPPTVRQSGDLRHGAKPLYITEGVRKADAGASAGLCIVDLLGVWNFRGTNESGGKTALGDWEHIHLKGRTVYIVYDSDVATKPDVAKAMIRLKALLEGRGAAVSVIYLPATADDKKQGLDDYLAAGGTVSDLMGLVSKEVREPPKDEPTPIGANYYVEHGSTFMLRSTPDGDVPVLLANFAATIVGDTQVDDGVESHREFEIRATIREHARTGAVTVPDFHGMSWPSEMLGATAAIGPGLGIRDHMRFAVQVLSPEVPRKTVHAHIGWKHIDGVGDCYLHAGGAQGPEGPVPDVQTRLPLALSLFALPTPADRKKVAQATSKAFDLLRLGPPRIVYPLLSLVFRAATGDSDLSGFFAGLSGTYKTATAALGQAFYAPTITAKSLPCSWGGTANSIELTAFYAKDALLVVDDFKPVGSPHDVARKHAQADQLLRAQGNLAGRSRLRADATLRATKPPRGLLLSTGEDVPFGASLNARMVRVEFKPGDINLAELTRCQADAAAGEYAMAMAGFVQFLAKDRSGHMMRFRSRADELRAAADGSGGHSRAPTNLAGLQAAWELFLAHALQVGAIDSERAERERRACWDALLAIGDRQADEQVHYDEVDMFFRQLAAGLASGAAHLADRSGAAPTAPSPAVCGWRRSEEGSLAAWREQGTRIGWIEGGLIYLIPEAAINVAQKMGSETERLTSTKRVLITRIAESGRLARQDTTRNKHCVRVAIGESRVNALCIEASLLLGQAPRAHGAQTGLGEDEKADFEAHARARHAGEHPVSGPAFGPMAMPLATRSPPAETDGPDGPGTKHDSSPGGAGIAGDGREGTADEEGEWTL